MKKLFINGTILAIGVVMGIMTASKLGLLKDVNSKYANGLNATTTNVATVDSNGDSNNCIENNLVLVESIYDGFVIDLKYATKKNITKTVLYERPLCYLQKNTLDKLIQANEELRLLGYKIKIWDAYRPESVQKKLWAAYPNSSFIANPFTTGSNHNRGAAVDITLVDLEGNEVDMPTGFDEFGYKCSRSFNASYTQKQNLALLTDTMKKYGFTTIESEWWHFDDSECKSYPIMNYSLRELMKKWQKKLKIVF